jgi:pimeloyl-ACP methyl ester carboxylesterase
MSLLPASINLSEETDDTNETKEDPNEKAGEENPFDFF